MSRSTPHLVKTLTLATLLSSSLASALAGSTGASVRLYAKASSSSPVLITLPSKTPLVIKGCSGGSQGWCTVTAAGRTGFLPRAQVKASGNCTALRAIGLGDLRRGEASYNGNRDRDGDGVGCDKA